MFGILSSHLSAFFTFIALEVENIVLTACVLLNYMLEKSLKRTDVSDAEDSHTHDPIPGEWCNDPELKQASLPSGTNASRHAIAHREYC